MFGAPGRGVWGLELTTPVCMAGALAQVSRNGPPPAGVSVAHFRNNLSIALYAQSKVRGDTATVLLFHEGRLFAPPSANIMPLFDETCMVGGLGGGNCTYTFVRWLFAFDDTHHIAGIGELVIRWDNIEKRVPINFDWLW